MESSKSHKIAAIIAAVIVVIALVVALAPLVLTPKDESGPYATSDGYTLCEKGKLTVTSQFDNQPFEMKSSTSYGGFTIDLMAEIADRMGLEVEFTNQRTIKYMPTMLTDNGADVAASSFAKGAIDSSSVDYTNPYFSYKLCALQVDLNSYEYSHRTEKNGVEFSSVSELAGHKVAVKKDSDASAWAEKNLKDSSLVYTDTDVDSMGQVKSGSAEACIVSEPVADYQIGLSYSFMRKIQTIDSTCEYVMAVSAQNSALKDKLNDVLAEMKSDGSYQQLYDKYFKATK